MWVRSGRQLRRVEICSKEDRQNRIKEHRDVGQ